MKTSIVSLFSSNFWFNSDFIMIHEKLIFNHAIQFKYCMNGLTYIHYGHINFINVYAFQMQVTTVFLIYFSSVLCPLKLIEIFEKLITRNKDVDGFFNREGRGNYHKSSYVKITLLYLQIFIWVMTQTKTKVMFLLVHIFNSKNELSDQQLSFLSGLYRNRKAFKKIIMSSF